MNGVITADTSLYARLARLHTDVFHDGSAYTDLFYSSDSRAEHLAYMADGDVAGILTLIPVFLEAGGRTFNGQYIFAVATAKQFRRRGISTALLEAAARRAEQNGIHVSLLAPAGNELFSFYGRRGYTEFCRVKELTADISALRGPFSACRFSEADTDTFMRIRRTYTEGRSAAVLQDRLGAELIIRENTVCGGETLLIKSDAGEGCAVCRTEGSVLRINELITCGLRISSAVRALALRFGADKVFIRLAADDTADIETENGVSCAVRPFVMARWHDAEAKAASLLPGRLPYMAHVFD